MRKILAFILPIFITLPLLAQNVDQSAYEKYINPKLYHQMVPGTIYQGNKKTETSIRYLEPKNMQDPTFTLTVNNGKGDEVLTKAKVDAIAYDGHIYVPEDLGDSILWVMLEREGAIRETIYFEGSPLNNPKYYKVYHMVTNTTTHEGHFVGALAVNFNKIMAAMTSENLEISAKIENREQGYRFIDYKKIIAEYNLWIQNEYPKRIKYFGDIPDFQALIDSDLSNYLPKN